MRSKQLLKLHENLSELNCHYSHYLFQSEQFIQDNMVLITNKSDQLVTSIYTSNKYASQFNVRLNDLPQEINNTKQFIIRSFYLLSISRIEIYSRDIYNFVAQFISLPELQSRKSPISQLIDNLSLSDDLDEEEINSLIYFRLRRNAFIHRDSKKMSQGELNNYIKANGKKLNKYWIDREIILKYLDFSDTEDLLNITGNSIIEIIILIRQIAEKIDSILLNKIEIPLCLY